MKVLISSNSCWNIFNFRLKIIKELIKKNYEIIIVAPEDEYKSKILSLGCKYIPIKLNPTSQNIILDISYIQILYNIIKKEKPDYFLPFTSKPNIYGSFICSFFNTKTINTITGMGSPFIKSFFTRFFLILFYKLALRKSYVIFFHNNYDRDLFINNKIIKKQNFFVIPGSGVDLNKFLHKEITYRNNDKRIFLFIGRLIFDKGIIELIESAHKIKKIYPNIIFKVVGSIDKHNKRSVNKKYMEKWIKEGVIIYEKFTDNISELIENCDCLVLPSYREGLSKTLLEASAIGRPMITNNVPGCKDIVIDNFNGFLCKEKNKESLIEALIKFIELDFEKVKILAINARKKAVKDFDDEIVVSKYLEVLK